MTLPKLRGVTEDGDVFFEYIAPHRLREAWPRIVPGLEAIREQNGEPWIPEDVYSELLHQRADLYLFTDEDDTLIGFSIFQLHYFPFDFAPALNVWVGWAAKRGDGKYGYELTRRLKREAGLTRAVFATSQDSAWLAKHRKLHTWYEVMD